MTFLHKQFIAISAICAVVLPASALAVGPGLGPKGVWMLTDGDNKTDVLIQGNTVRTFTQDPNSSLQYPIQWDGAYNQWETIGRDKGGMGGVYTIDHVLIKEFENFSSFDGQHTDGTLDTLDNISYATDYSTGDVVQYGDGYFNAPTASIWNGGATSIWSITYDSALDTLFVGQNGFITEIDDSGKVLGTFKTQSGPVRSLAYDALDDTMWYLSTDGTTAYQTDAVGDDLSYMTVNLGGNYWGGEIAPVPASVPGPAALLPFAVGGLSLLARRRRRS